MAIATLRGTLSNGSTKTEDIEGISINGYWTDKEGNRVKNTFWGDTVCYYLAGRYHPKNVHIQLYLIIDGIKISILEGKIDLSNRVERDLCLIQIQIVDRWELPPFQQKNKIAEFFCEIKPLSPLYNQEYRDYIIVDEFKVENNFIVKGPNIQVTQALVCRKLTQKVNAVVLHRTDSDNVESPLSSASKNAAAHIYINKNGDIYNKISLNEEAPHVGRIKKRGDPKSIAYKSVFDEEKLKDYPIRYPYNKDSIGIEVVGKSIRNSDNSFEYPPLSEDEQIKSVARIVNFLLGYFSLNKDEDIYAHEIISSKTKGEGQLVYDAIAKYLI